MKPPALGTRLLTHLGLLVFTAATLLPVVLVVTKALSAGQELTLELIPTQPTLDNFRDVVGHPLFLRQLLNSVVAATGTTVVGVFLACTAAYATSRFRFPGQRGLLLGFLVVQMFPGSLLMIPLYVLMDRLGLLDQLLGLVLIYSTTAIPFCVWMLKGYFDTIPKELEEAARIDGASRFYIFYGIVLPLARPAIAVTALFSFMTAWNEFILASTFTSQERAYTLPVVLQHYVGEHTTEWGHFAASAILVSVPVMALFYVLQRHLVAGLTAGSVKG
jgi:arabinogalactan oligomer/maltooligosaccharide transport system permease protein